MELRMKRRIVSILLTACMMMSLLPGTALAVEEVPKAPPACTCEAACTAEHMDENCSVRGGAGASPEDCGLYQPLVEDRLR